MWHGRMQHRGEWALGECTGGTMLPRNMPFCICPARISTDINAFPTSRCPRSASAWRPQRDTSPAGTLPYGVLRNRGTGAVARAHVAESRGMVEGVAYGLREEGADAVATRRGVARLLSAVDRSSRGPWSSQCRPDRESRLRVRNGQGWDSGWLAQGSERCAAGRRARHRDEGGGDGSLPPRGRHQADGQPSLPSRGAGTRRVWLERSCAGCGAAFLR